MLFSIPMTFQTLTGIHKPRKHQILIAGPQILSKSHNYPHPLALIVYEHSFYPEQLSPVNCYINNRKLKFNTEADGFFSPLLQSLYLIESSPKAQTIHQSDVLQYVCYYSSGDCW